jgi:glutamate-1-semialdehyde aminotransferase
VTTDETANQTQATDETADQTADDTTGETSTRLKEIIAEQEEIFVRRQPESQRLAARARQHLAGGVTSSWQITAPQPVWLSHGRGSKVWDVDGNEYVDLHGGYGAALAGHAHPAIARAISGLTTHVVTAGAKGCVVFADQPVTDYRGFLGVDDRYSHAHWLYQHNGGVFLPPWGKIEQWLISVQHDEADIDRLIENFAVFARAVGSVGQGRQAGNQG